MTKSFLSISRAAAAIAAGYAYGLLSGRLPAPEHTGLVWLSALLGPYLVLGFLAGAWASASALVGTATAAAVEVAAAAGFHGWLLEQHGWDHALTWVPLALIAGAVFGWFGNAWAWRANRGALRLLGLALLLEPTVYLTALDSLVRRSHFLSAVHLPAYSHAEWNLALWGFEAMLGTLLVVLAALPARASGRPPVYGTSRNHLAV
jgi:hypothetical protein